MNEPMTVLESIQKMKVSGHELAKPLPVDGLPPMKFECAFLSSGADMNELNELWPTCPPDLQEFWRITRSACLFKDIRYGQWGLEILDPLEVAVETAQYRDRRSRYVLYGDLIIGRFFGDSDRLLIRCDPDSADYGTVIVALPIEPRSDWYEAGKSFRTFLDRYVNSGGEKFWEE